MDSYCEKILMPDGRFKVKSFYTASGVHDIQVHPHWHDAVEVLFYASGCAKQQVNEHIFTAEAGDIVVISKDQLHSTYTYNGSRCSILVIQFDAAAFTDIDAGFGEKSLSETFGSNVIFNMPIKSTSKEGRTILDCILGIHNELDAKQGAYKYLVRSHLYKFAGLLQRYGFYVLRQRSLEDEKRVRNMLEKTFMLINNNYFDDIPLKKAAQVSNLSVTHFCRLFKKTTGMTFSDYLSFYRVNRAERLLDSSRTITEVTMDCGFGSLSSFIRNFRKYKNCTPSEYMKLKRHRP